MKYLIPFLAFLLSGCSCTRQHRGSAVGVLVSINEFTPPSPSVCDVYTRIVLQTAQSGRSEFSFTNVRREMFQQYEGKNIEVQYVTFDPGFGCDRNEISIKVIN